jgi:diguanylate cyclase (GGDEF)-like protein
MKGLGLRAKLAIFMALYTITALSLISVFLYQRIQAEQANSRWAQMHLRAMQWGTYVADRAASGISLRDIKGEPPLPADSGQLAALVSCESVGVFSATGERVSVLKEFGNDSLPASVASGPDGARQAGDDTGLAMMVNLSIDGVEHVVYCHFGLPADRAHLSGVYWSIGKVAATLLLLVGLLAFAAHRLIIRPILTITDATERVSEGDLSESFRLNTGDELETLARRFNRMLGRVRQMREMALDSSPLTGLPGNNSIQQRIEAALADGKNAVIVYADIDSFKAYNDVYGFEAGDRAIRMTAEMLQDALAGLGNVDGFLGHIGGDDFVAVVPDGEAEGFAVTVCAEFDLRVKRLYREKDVKRGGIRAVDREGKERRFPFMSISLGAVCLARGRFRHFSEVASVAAEVKKAAKGKRGSSYVMDRRSGRPVQYERADTGEMPAVRRPRRG